jgi:hypothetical protein
LWKPVVPLDKEPYWVIKEWDEMIAFALYGCHLDLGQHTVTDWDKPTDTMPGSFQRTPKPKSAGKGKEPATPPHQQSSSSQHTGSHQQQSQQPADDQGQTSHDEDNDNADDEGSDDQNSLPDIPSGGNATGGGDDDPGDNSSSSSDSESSAPSIRPRPNRATKRTARGKTPEQLEWEAISGSVAPDPRISKGLKNIQIDAPENLKGDDPRWKDSQYFDTWVNAMERWMTIKGIDLNSEDALTVTGLKMQGSALTTYNHFLRQHTTTAQRTFFKFILVLRQFLIPSTSKATLWNRWDKGTIYNVTECRSCLVTSY